MMFAGFNQNTAVSYGVLVSLVAGLVWLLSSLSGIKSDVNELKSSMLIHEQSLDTRVLQLEKNGETWTLADQYKWSIHLQQANSKMNPPLNVPEPTHNQ